MEDTGYERDVDRTVIAGCGTKASANVDDIDPFVATDHDPHCNDTRKNQTVVNSRRHHQVPDAPANMFGFELWFVD